jgi:dTDP-glucose 4,6-dehydratase
MKTSGNKTYLITGGAGFIGSNFIDFLYQQEPEAKVRVLDKLTYSGNPENLTKFQKYQGFEFIIGDICNSDIVKKVICDVNVIVNFAAEVAVDRSIDNPKGFLQTDILGVYTLLVEAWKLKSLKRFVQISTDEVYGQIFNGKFTEQSELKPRNPYSASKLGGERLAYSFFETYNIPVVITRASNTYGPRAYPEKITPLFITNLIDGLKVPLYGDGRQIRDWVHVKDHCHAIYAIINKGTNGEVYNIGAGQECSNIELARKIIKVMGKNESMIKFVKDRPGHDFRYSVDWSKLKSLGWYPTRTLDEGLKQVIEWYKGHEKWWRTAKEKLPKRFLAGYWGD